MGLVLDFYIYLRNAKIIQKFFKNGEILLENKKALAIQLVTLYIIFKQYINVKQNFNSIKKL